MRCTSGGRADRVVPQRPDADGGPRVGAAALAAAAATASVIAITAAVNEPANHRFVSGKLTGPETTELLNEWARWHHVRVVLGLVATCAATVALAQLDDTGPWWPRRLRATAARRSR